MRVLPDRKQLPLFLFRLSALAGLMIIGGCLMVSMPGKSHTGPLPSRTLAEQQATGRLRADVTMLSVIIGERNTERYDRLRLSADWLTATLQRLGYTVTAEPYSAAGRAVSNIVAQKQGTQIPEEIVLIGAHYDSPPGSPGANDNASGVAALLELARQFKDAKSPRTLRFVAFINEEPPFFQTDAMGSRVHAANARKRGDKIIAMLSLETIGYYSDSKGSQHYPPPFSLLYPDTGNFIAFVGNLSSRSLVRSSISAFRQTTPFPSEGLATPEFIKGIGWSDHWAFWQEGYPGIMITDTAPFRYPHYHEETDTPDKLDYDRMVRVVDGIGRAVKGLVSSGINL